MAPIQLPLAFDNAARFVVIFDKDGTLIDFRAMWSTWLEQLGARVAAAAGMADAAPLFAAVGYSSATGAIDPLGVFALATMAEFRRFLVEFLAGQGVAQPAAVEAAAWLEPDPVGTARPLADLGLLFGALERRSIQVAVATSDNRALTEATLAALGVAGQVSALVCADDGLPVKPAPDMLLALCARLGIAPAQAIMVGDTVHDVAMGRAAGAGLVVGVLSGITGRELLAPHADLILPSIAELLPALGIAQ